jgi:hypothetical protein
MLTAHPNCLCNPHHKGGLYHRICYVTKETAYSGAGSGAIARSWLLMSLVM